MGGIIRITPSGSRLSSSEFLRENYNFCKDYDEKNYPTHTLYKHERKDTSMSKSQVLINFRVPSEKKVLYTEAAEVIGVSISEICRKALDNAVILAETLKTPKPTPPPATITEKGVFIRKGEEWVEKP